MDAAERLIVALDVADTAAARRIVESLDGAASMFKLGPWLMLAPGFESLLDDLVSAGKEVFLDSKISDIPETMAGGVRAAGARGVRFMTMHGHDEATDAAITAALEARTGALQLLCVTVLTSIGPADLARAGKTGPVRDLVVARAGRALALGCDGVIASPEEATAIRELADGRDFLIVTPGIRPAGSALGDQKRAATPASAIAAGADYLVVGRPIVRADIPADAAHAIISEMQDAFDKRAG